MSMLYFDKDLAREIIASKRKNIPLAYISREVGGNDGLLADCLRRGSIKKKTFEALKSIRIDLSTALISEEEWKERYPAGEKPAKKARPTLWDVQEKSETERLIDAINELTQAIREARA